MLCHSRKGSGETPSVCDTSRSNDKDRLASQRALGVLADVDASGDEDGEGSIACVSTTLATLRADDVDTLC